MKHAREEQGGEVPNIARGQSNRRRQDVVAVSCQAPLALPACAVAERTSVNALAQEDALHRRYLTHALPSLHLHLQRP